ncbi:MAG: excinuclease ABC subunit UvrC [Oligoflexia bacterium]|nr:excinuclease ABC subunit UvrC [Oligoflexia bacterium]MBF0366095.1 excinuclease ABC subunit UvrC [Oligoflexia bacterium]
MNSELLLEIAKQLPVTPGCYLFWGEHDNVLYVGKAKSLRDRVSSYFRLIDKLSIKTQALVKHIERITFMDVDSEHSALILENNLIKEHNPKYNIRLRDDKTYPYMEINLSEEYPRIMVVRRPKFSEGKRYIFGPYVSGTDVRSVARALNKSLRLRGCSLQEFHRRKHACILYEMKQCLAPCEQKLEEGEYAQRIQYAIDFLGGIGRKRESALAFLKREMREAAEREDFEFAASLRDNIKLLNHWRKYYGPNQIRTEVEQLLVSSGGMEGKSVDIVSYAIHEIAVDIVVYEIRKNLWMGHKHFFFARKECEGDLQEEISRLLSQYYDTKSEERVVISELLPLADQSMVQIQRASLLLKIANRETQKIQEERIKRLSDFAQGLLSLQRILNLQKVPERIECYDIAIWQGKSPTASQVVFIHGTPAKELYRYFHLKERPEGNNDFLMLEEVLTRRLHNIKSCGEHPDLIVVDGGRGQLSVMRRVVLRLKLAIPVTAIAKAKSKAKYDALYVPDRKNPYSLAKDRSLSVLLASMRDEAHRFSRQLHHKSEERRQFHSLFDGISGIGARTKEKILRQFRGEYRDLQKYSAEELAKEWEITLAAATQILERVASTLL